MLDPFAGSGTVGKVAIENGRNAVLCDLVYQDLAARRISGVQRPAVSKEWGDPARVVIRIEEMRLEARPQTQASALLHGYLDRSDLL